VAYAKHGRSGFGDGGPEVRAGIGRRGSSDRSPMCDGLGDAERQGLEGHAGDGGRGNEPGRVRSGAARHAPTPGWDGCGLVRCVEPRSTGPITVYRRAPLEPSLQPLAHGVPGRSGLIRGAGNAIVPQVAARFVRAAMEVIGI
jgi:DNA (cytosine-5)-methyltransferase 1